MYDRKVQKKYRENNREKRKQASANWRNAAPGRQAHADRKCYLKRTFGMTIEDYETLFTQQKGLCAICQEPETFLIRNKPQRLSIDHDHVTGKVRGLLCAKCNAALGGFKDSGALLRAAIDYLGE